MSYKLSASKIVFDDGSTTINNVSDVEKITSSKGEKFCVTDIGCGNIIFGEYGTRGTLTNPVWTVHVTQYALTGSKIVFDNGANNYGSFSNQQSITDSTGETYCFKGYNCGDTIFGQYGSRGIVTNPVWGEYVPPTGGRKFLMKTLPDGTRVFLMQKGTSHGSNSKWLTEKI